MATEIDAVPPPGFTEIELNVPHVELEKRLEEVSERLKNTTIRSVEMETLVRCLPQKRFMRNESEKIRLLTACCLADLFRLMAPESPFSEKVKLKTVLDFLVEHFKCNVLIAALMLYELSDVLCGADYDSKKASYVVACLATAKTLNLYLDLASNQCIIEKTLSCLLSVVRSIHTQQLKHFMVDILVSLINEADSISDDLIGTLKKFLMKRDDCKVASQLCREVIVRASSGLESHMELFLRDDLGQGSAQKTFEIFMELFKIVPQNLTQWLLQLDTSLHSKKDSVRLEATELAARIFAATDLIFSYPHLWNSFLSRFNDVNYRIRMKCVEQSLPLIISQPQIRDDLVEAIKKRQHDMNESVRFQMVFTILRVAERNFNTVQNGLLDVVKERTLDTNFKVRRLALLGIGELYRKFTSRPPPVSSDPSVSLPEWVEDSASAEEIEWIRDKVLHRYYQTSLQDRLIVERVLYTCLVPFWLPSEERTTKLHKLFTSCDENAVKALIQILKFQHTYKQQMKRMMHLADESEDSDEKPKEFKTLAQFMAQQISDDASTETYIIEFLQLVRGSPTLHRHMTRVLEAKTFEEVNENVVSIHEWHFDGIKQFKITPTLRIILRTLGNPESALFATVKQLLERIAPLVVDSSGVQQIIEIARENLECVQEAEARRNLELLIVLSEVHPDTFMTREILGELGCLLSADWDSDCISLLLQILYNLRNKRMEEHFPDLTESLKPVLVKMLQSGTPKQAKYSARCINRIYENVASVFSDVLIRLKGLLDKQSSHLETILVSLGHIAALRPECFNPHREHIVVEVVVKKILMRPFPKRKLRNDLAWLDVQSLPVAIRRRLAAMKLLAKSLTGLANLYCQRVVNADEERKKLMQQFMLWDAECTLRLLFTAVENDGDLMKSSGLTDCEKSHFKLRAATSILKICSFKNYVDIVTARQIRSLVKVITDSSDFVRERFCEKLHRRLITMKIPLHFMALFSYGALEPKKRLKDKIKSYLMANIKKRREYLKDHDVDPFTRINVLPENVVVFVIHMLAHDPSFRNTNNVEELGKIQECLWFQLQFHCTASNENYSFSFYRKLVETIKRSKDREGPQDEDMNKRLYAICDMILGLIMSRTTDFRQAAMSDTVRLPTELFVQPTTDAGYNSKYYLPPELRFSPSTDKKATPSAKARRSLPREVRTPSRKRTKKSKANTPDSEDYSEDSDEHE